MPFPRRILITAGPTREMLDPIRFISNLSTGTLGYTLAEIARQKKYHVTLISGPTMISPPKGVRLIPVVSAKEMKQACEKQFPKHDILVMTAAVSDFMATRKYPEKLRRKEIKRIDLKPTVDIVASLAKKKGKRLVIGFSLETKHWIRNALQKLKEKGLDGIVANVYRPGASPFGNQRITTAFVNKAGKKLILRNQSKRQIAYCFLKWLETSQQ